MSNDKAGRTEAVLIGAPGADLRHEGELEPALLSRLDGAIGAGLTQLEVARICSREGYLADLQRGFAVIPQAYNERFAIIARCNTPEIVVNGSNR